MFPLEHLNPPRIKGEVLVLHFDTIPPTVYIRWTLIRRNMTKISIAPQEQQKEGHDIVLDRNQIDYLFVHPNGRVVILDMNRKEKYNITFNLEPTE